MSLFKNQTTNPVFVFDGSTAESSVVKKKFSRLGVFIKVMLGISIMTAILFFLLTVPKFTGFLLENFKVIAIVSTIFLIVLIMFGRKSPKNARIAFFGYAIVEGILVSTFTIFFNYVYPGIAFMALFITLCDVLVMSLIYVANPGIVTQKFKSVMYSLIGAISLFYIVSFMYSIFTNQPLIEYNSGLAIAISFVIVIVASLTLLLDFDAIENYRKSEVDKGYEWIAALGLLVTIVWIYLEVLRLLSRLKKR